MRRLSGRPGSRISAAGGGLLGLGLAGGYALRDRGGSAHGPPLAADDPVHRGAQAPMMGDGTPADMSTYMELFSRHAELRRTVQLIPGGVGTVTEADDSALAAPLQSTPASVYSRMYPDDVGLIIA